MTQPSTEILYGFILRSNGKSRDVMCDLSLESTLLTTVRKYIYNIPRRPDIDTAENRRKYIILRAMLSSTGKVFTKLFPQYGPEFSKYAEDANIIVDKIHAALQTKAARISLYGLGQVDCGDDNNHRNVIACELLRYIECELGMGVNPLDIHSRSIINDYVKDLIHLDIYYSAYESHEVL
jgi:hypothetical protein